MSSLLNHIDNNRSEDDEDDHINRLFPKCKPRASSLSMSPSLQHMSHDSTSSTSASDLCLTTPALEPSNRNSLSNRNNNNKNNSNRNQCSNVRRHSAHNYSNDTVSKQESWSQSQSNREFTEIIPQNGQAQHIYDNNNPEYISDCLKPTITPQAPPIVKQSSESTHKNPSTRHKRIENHNIHQRNPTRTSRTDRKQGNNKPVPPVTSHPCKNQHNTGNPSLPSSSVPQAKGKESQRTLEAQTFPSGIPNQVKSSSVTRICKSKEDKVYTSITNSVTKGQHCQPPLPSESVIAMECNAIEDNFDNGIGSACSRSSGESSISNTSDFMENLVSPVNRGSAVVAGNGGNGFPPAVPSMGILRDSRIEIAGGREVYSQNRIRASRRHRGYVSSTNDMADPAPCSANNISSSKMRKKSLHSHSAYQQQHHCCHTNPCCGSTVNCSEVSLPGGPLVWEPNHSCRRPTAVETPGSRQQYLSHSNSMGGPHQGVKCTHGCGFCGNHGFDYNSKFPPDFESGPALMGRNHPHTHGTSPSSPMAIIETVFSSEVKPVENSMKGNPQGKEKVNCELRSPCQIEPVIYEAKVGDGKVVFDDIGEWRERQIDVNNPVECGYDGGDEHDLSESQAIKKGQLQSPPSASQDITNESSKNISRNKNSPFATNNVDDLIEGSPCASNKDGNTTPSGYESDECSASASATNNSIVTPIIPNLRTSPNFGNKRVIGSIPIAEYEGSPKRYGLKQQTHPAGTHFELVDVDIDMSRESDQNLIGNEHRGQSLIEQTIAAATSSSSSSLDNTNTNVSSNSSSRTNHRISPRALSPSQPISGYGTRFPGFPQRVNAPSSTSSENNGAVTRTSSNQTSPNYDDPKSRTNHREEFNKSPVRMIQQTDGSVLPVNVSSLPLESLAGHMSMNIGSTDFSTDDSVASQHGSANTPLSTNSDQDVLCTRTARSVREDIGLMVDTDEAGGSSGASRNQDLLYEFSETRKVLEEFFNASGNPNAEHCRADKASFDELDYTLKRQAGNSYVGQRLAGDIAGNTVAEDSPKKPPRRGVLLLGSDGDGSDEKGSPKLISFHEISLPQLHSLSPAPQPSNHRLSSHVQSHSFTASSNRSPRSLKSHSRSQSQSPAQYDPTRDINDNDIDVETASTNTETDLGDTEVGLQVGHSRNFTLSPETTDCDSNELESELSLDYEASLHSSSRIGLTMPAVEDGLSSGNESENEDIIEVDVGFHDEHCYLTGNEIKPAHSPTLGKNTDNSPGGIHKKSIYQSNRDKVTTFFGPECIPTGLLDWNSPSIQTKTFIEGDFDGEENDKPFGEANSSEPNPTLMLMKKQISEIEKEIQLRASQQCQRLQNIPTDSLIETDIDMNVGNACISSNELHSPSSSQDRRSSESQDLPGNMFGGNSNGGGGQVKGPSGNKNAIGYPEPGRSDNASFVNNDPELDALDPMRPTPPPSPAPGSAIRQQHPQQQQLGKMWKPNQESSSRACASNFSSSTSHSNVANFDRIVETSMGSSSMTASESCGSLAPTSPPSATVAAAIQDIKEAIQRTKPLPQQRQGDRPLVNPSSSSNPPTSTLSCVSHNSRIGLREQLQHSTSHEREAPLICDSSPVWVPRQIGANSNLDHRSDNSGVRDPLLKKQRYDDTPDDDADTDQETDRLLGQTRTEDDYGFYDEKDWKKPKSRSLLPAINKGVAFVKSAASSVPSSSQAPLLSTSASSLPNSGAPSANNNSGGGDSGGSLPNNSHSNTNNHPSALTPSTSAATTTTFSSQHLIHSKSLSPTSPFDESQVQLSSAAGSKSKKEKDGVKKKRSKEDFLKNPSVLIEGVLFRARYLGSTQLTCEGQPTKATRMMQAEEAVSRIKAQPNQNGTLSHGTSEMQTQPPQVRNGTGGSATASDAASLAVDPHQSTNNLDPPPSLSTSSSICRETDFENSVSKLRKNLEESNGELDDYFYPEEEESCCEDESLDEADGDEDLFEKSARQSTGSTSSLRDKGMRLPLNDFHGSSNALQIHDNHTHPLSLHHNRQSGGGGGGVETGASASSSSQPPVPHLSPPCGSALPGTMFRLRFVGSLEVDEEIGSGKRRRKRPKKTMVEEAVMKMKAPEGETQPSTEVDLFISTEKIMVLNTDLKEIMMDHALRTISYIADIGDLVVLMARRRPVPTDTVDESKPPRPPKMICHVFESDEAQYIAQSIGQAFQVAYMEFLKANGIEDSSFVREMDYQEVLNSQEIFGDELQMFAKKELQKEVVVPKTKGEILGVVIVESGWGSMLPTVVIANLAPAGAAARCGQLNIGDQIIAINGVSLVGLPLSTCQTYIKNTKTQTVVKLTVVPCPPVVEVKIKRPDTKYQLGFSVQNGVICSLLRGGIAERGGVRVGHRIIEINNQSVVAVPHEKIVNLLATSVGEINMKTMPTSMFRLLTGQETPLYI